MSEFRDLVKNGETEREAGLKREQKRLPIGKFDEEKKTEINGISDQEKAVLLAMTMESIRGYWGESELRLGMVAHLCDVIPTTVLPEPLLKAIKHNAYLFNGHLIDGRIFRDGDRKFGLSGNIAYSITGDDRIKQEGFYGTYYEVWAIVGRNEETMKKVYLKCLLDTADMTWDHLCSR